GRLWFEVACWTKLIVSKPFQPSIRGASTESRPRIQARCPTNTGETPMIRFKFKHTTVECMLARLLASVAAGLIVGVVTPPVAQQFQATLSPFVPTVLGLVTGVLTWFATRRVFAFTADCLNVPDSTPAFQGGPKPRRAEMTARPAPAAAPTPA